MSSTSIAHKPDALTHHRAGGIFLALIPWVLFSVITQHDTLTAAALVALLTAMVIAAPGVLRGQPKLLELGAVATFAGFTIVAFLADPATAEWIARYARAIAAGGLAMIAFGSLLFTPFTEQYARESVPRSQWSSPRFKHINRRLSTFWAWVFVALVPCHIAAGAIDTRRANTICNWVIPIVLIVWAAKRTQASSNPPSEDGTDR